jgi:DNA-binding transcriptional LysR family regulator
MVVRASMVAAFTQFHSSLPPDMATAALAPALIGFKARYPDVTIEMTLADRRVSLIEEGYDLVVRVGPVADSELMFRKIADLPRALVASPAFLSEHSDLSTHRTWKSCQLSRSAAIWSNGI